MLRPSEIASSRALDAVAPPTSRGPKQSRSGVEASASSARELFFGPGGSPLSSRPSGPGFVKRGSPVQSRGAAPEYNRAQVRVKHGGQPRFSRDKDRALAPASRAIIRKYARRNPWLELQDLTQQAAIAAIEARGHCTSSGEAYQVAQVLSRFVAATRRAPLAVPGHDGSETDNPELSALATAEYVPIEDQLDSARTLAAAVALLEARSEAARAVVLDDEKPAEVAARLGLSRAEVYDQAARAVRALRKALGKQGGNVNVQST